MPEHAPKMEEGREVFHFPEHKEFYDEEVQQMLGGKPIESFEKMGDRYRKIRELGGGGMGQTYLVVDEKTGRILVVKRLHANLLSYEHTVKRFQREIHALAKSENPYIVKAHDVITFPGPSGKGVDLGLVMEYVKGKDLFDALRDERFFDEKQAADVAIQVCFALSGAHEKGIVHRDLKPENVFVDEAGHVRVGDFGIAGFTDNTVLRPQDLTDQHGRRLTAEGTAFGTPEYLSPEAGRGERVDGRADLYSLGVIMYRMLAGRLPFRGGNKLILVNRQINEPPKPFSELAAMPEPNKNTALELIVMKLLEKDPTKRYQTAFEAAQAIKKVIVEKYPELLHKEPFDLVPLYEEDVSAAQEERKAA